MWFDDIIAPRIAQAGVESLPRRALLDFLNASVTDDAANGKKIITVQVPANLTVSETLAIAGTITPAIITTTQNDYNPSGLADATVLRLTSSGAQSITGLQGGAAGRFILLANVGVSDITLLASSGGSSSANRFSFTGARYLISPLAMALLVYDAVVERWRTVGPTVDPNQIDLGDSGTAITADFTQGPFLKTRLTGNAVVTLTPPPRHRHVQLDWIQDETGSRTIIFSPSPKWAGGSPPSWSSSPNARNSVTLFWNGTDWVGSGLVGIDLV